MITYTWGITCKTTRIITKSDIVVMCKLLNESGIYSEICDFTPEGISEGGILYNFKKNDTSKWYKSVRICTSVGESKGKWYWVNENVMSEWGDNQDVIFPKNNKFITCLKSFHGAPVFTLDELKVWEHCFQQIGIVRVGKYPTKKSLSSEGTKYTQ